MALTKPQKQTKDFSEKSGAILVTFVNEESTAKAIVDLHHEFRKAFKVILFSARRASRWNQESVRKEQQMLRTLFDELQVDKTLEESDTIKEYNTDYYCLCHGQLFPDARYQDQTHLLKELEAKGGTNFAAVLAILIFQYLKYENRKEIKKCQLPQCGKYLLARNKKRKCCSFAHKQAQYRLNKTAQNCKTPHEIDVQPPPVMPQDCEPMAMTHPVSPS